MLESFAAGALTKVTFFEKPFSETYSSGFSQPMPQRMGDPENLEPAPTNIQKFVVEDAAGAWFWEDEWQRGEQEAQADILAGRGEFFANSDAFLESLQALAAPLPTYFRSDRFNRDYERLTSEQKERFREAVRKLIEDLTNGRPPRASLGIRSFKSAPGVFEFHFEGDGRATFSFGEPVIPGEIHIDWRRVGTHDVYNAP